MSNGKDKYIILTPCITGVGGGQQYVYNKTKAMSQLGYEVHIFSATPGEIIINGINDYSNKIIAELMFQPMFFSNGKKKSVLAMMIKLCGICNKKSIIESNDQATSQWGEMLAKKLGCLNLIYLFTENPRAYSFSEAEFYLNKLSKKELFFNSVNNAKSLFSNFYSISLNEIMLFEPYCANVVEDEKDDISTELVKCNYNICSIGRLEKAYVPQLVTDLHNYFKKNPNHTFNLVFLGGCNNKKRIKMIHNSFYDLDNCNLIITGKKYPIPRSFIKKIDLFISSSGSAWVSASEGKVTIKIPFDGSKYGFAYYDNEGKGKIDEVSDNLDCLINIGLTKKKDIHSGNINRFDSKEILINKHLVQMSKQDFSKKSYFDIEQIRPFGFKRNLEVFLGFLLGGKGLQLFLHLLRF